MWYLNDTDAVKDGDIVCLGFDWGEYDKPSEADLQSLWPTFYVKKLDVELSCCLIAPNRFITIADLKRPAYAVGAKKVVAIRVDRPKLPIETLGDRVVSDLGKLNDFLFSPVAGGNGEGGALGFGSAKTIAIVLVGACLVVAGGVVVYKLLGGSN